MRADALVGGKYRLLTEIGSGGMGTVWRARNEVTEREFAIKLLHAEVAASPRVVKRFLQEARVSGKLRHPSILEIFDAGTSPELDGAPYLVMELLDGAPLDVVVRRLRKLPVGIALEVTATIARAVAVAHDKGILHRDLKPANVFLHRPGTGAVVPKLLDFGISKILTQPEIGRSLGLTQTGTILGSPLYMSPEQVEGGIVLDARSDVYSLGLLLWECLAGRSPYRATTYHLLVAEQLGSERARLVDVLPDVPPLLDALVSRTLVRDRDKRLGSARELADALDAQRAALGLSSVLERPTAAEWLFAQIDASSVPAVPAVPSALSPTTTEAVSVGRGLPNANARGARAGIANEEEGDEAFSHAPTQVSEGAAEGRTPSPRVRVSVPPTGSAPASRDTGVSVKSAIRAAVGMVVLAVAASGAILVAKRAPEDARPAAPSGAIATALPVPPPATAPPSVTPQAVPPPQPVPAPPASAIASASPRPVPAATARRDPRPAVPPRAAKDAGVANVNHGIVNDGL